MEGDAALPETAIAISLYSDALAPTHPSTISMSSWCQPTKSYPSSLFQDSYAILVPAQNFSNDVGLSDKDGPRKSMRNWIVSFRKDPIPINH